MSEYLGDFLPGDVIGKKFTTVAKADGAPITLSGSPAVSVYKKGSTTESVAGVTLTVDYDTRTGLHDVSIDTSADATFYARENEFEAVMTAGTVDGVSVVGYSLFSFSLDNRSKVLNRTRRAMKTVVLGTVAASSTATVIKTSSLDPIVGDTDQYIGRIVIFDKDTTTTQLRGSSAIIQSVNSGTGDITLTAALSRAPASGDTFTIT